jgi:hypothetical protein
MNPTMSKYDTAASPSGITSDPEAIHQTQAAPCIDIISQTQSPLPHDCIDNSHHDYDAKLKSCCKSPGPEMLCFANSAIPASQVIMKNDIALVDDNGFAARFQNNIGICKIQDGTMFRDTNMLEMFDITHDQPTPVQVGYHSANSTKERNYIINLDHEDNTNSGSGRDTSTTRTTIQVNDNSFRSAATEAKIPVATAIDTPDEETLHEATEYSSGSKVPFYKSTRILALTCFLLVVISAVVTVSVVVSTKKLKEIQNVEVVASPPTPSPTPQRDAKITAMIERYVLKRNATWSNLLVEDPRHLALNWILHEDEMQLEANDPKLKQRYTLALMGIEFDYRAWNSHNNESSDSFDWLTSEDECQWFGISCSKDGEVTGVELCKFASIPDSFISCYSRKLSFLLTADNNMNGQILPEVGNLNALNQLALDHNCLFGTMPSEIGLLSNLQLIYLQSNGLSGSLADEFYNLTMLAKVDLTCQSGEKVCWWKKPKNCTSSDDNVIDPFSQKGDPENDENIGFQGKFLERITQLRHLTFIDIHGNSFSGSIASDIGNLEKLGTFHE